LATHKALSNIKDSPEAVKAWVAEHEKIREQKLDEMAREHSEAQARCDAWIVLISTIQDLQDDMVRLMVEIKLPARTGTSQALDDDTVILDSEPASEDNEALGETASNKESAVDMLSVYALINCRPTSPLVIDESIHCFDLACVLLSRRFLVVRAKIMSQQSNELHDVLHVAQLTARVVLSNMGDNGTITLELLNDILNVTHLGIVSMWDGIASLHNFIEVFGILRICLDCLLEICQHVRVKLVVGTDVDA